MEDQWVAYCLVINYNLIIHKVYRSRLNNITGVNRLYKVRIINVLIWIFLVVLLLALILISI